MHRKGTLACAKALCAHQGWLYMDTVRRGYVPKDAEEFGPKAQAKMDAAAQETQFLLDRGYDVKSATTFVGNHHLLSERQRMALARMLTPKSVLEARVAKELSTSPTRMWVDGFNIIITLEVALSGSLLLAGEDGTIRDLAGLRGTYRIVDKTLLAVQMLIDVLLDIGCDTQVYLDQQVSNSGRLRDLIQKKAEESDLTLRAVLSREVDHVLATAQEPVVTADAIVLDKCASWYNLGARLIRERIPNAWIFRAHPEY